MSLAYSSITSRSEFRRLAADGKKAPCRTMVLQHISVDNNERHFVGFTVSRHVGNAVKRSRVKRKLRAVVADVISAGDMPMGNTVVIARASAYEADFKTLLRDFRYCLKKL